MAEKRGKCHHCHRTVDLNSNFCNHCGGKLNKIKYKAIKCNRCGKTSDELHTFCPHCGQRLRVGGSNAFARLLGTIAGIILVIIIFALVFGNLKKQDAEDVIRDFEMSGLSCEWKDNYFTVCGKAEWNGEDDDYVKIFVPGHDESDAFYEKSLDFCYNSDDKEGFKIVRGIVYDDIGNSVKEVGEGVECKKPSVKKTTDTKTTREYNFKRRLQFTMYSDDESGINTYIFPDNVLRCNYDGNFVIKDNIFTKIKSSCDGATGLLSGSASGKSQNVVSDANSAVWDGKTQRDPQSVYHEGYFAYVDLCSSNYYNKKENYARAKISGFGTNTLAVNWDYSDKERKKRSIDVTYEMDCVLKEKA